MTKEAKTILYKFVKFIKGELGITSKFTLKLGSKREDFNTYAYYNDVEKLVAIYVKDRALADVLRSIAHEFVHMKQHEDGKIKGKIKYVGGPEENEANAKGGALIKQFGYNIKDKEKIDIYSL